MIAVFFTQQSGAQDIVSAASALPIEDGTVRNTDNSVLQDTIDLAQDSVIENPNEIVTDTTLSNEQVSGEKEYMDYNLTKEYTIADITVSGNVKYDQQTLVMLSGLAVGQKITIPGDRISNAMELFWKQGNFGNVEITAAKISGDHIYLNIYLEESPKLSTFEIQGIKRMDASNLKDEIDIKEGSVVTPNSIRLIKNKSE